MNCHEENKIRTVEVIIRIYFFSLFVSKKQNNYIISLSANNYII
jgi:hypothetical protein